MSFGPDRPLRIAIGIDDLFGPVPDGGGQGRVIINLIRHLAAIDSDSAYTLFATRPIGTIPRSLADLPANFRIVQIPAHRPALRFLQWHVLRRPFIERWIGPQDVVHSTTPSAVPAAERAKMVLTVYDLVWLHFPSGLNRWGRFFHRTGLYAAVRSGAAIVAISHATRNDINELIGSKQIRGGLHTFQIASAEPVSNDVVGDPHIAARSGINKPYIVSVGTLEPRKNHRRLLQAFAMLSPQLRSQYQLVLVGAVGWKLPAITAMVSALGLDGQVVWTNHLVDADMERVVGAATVFAYPSLYEGFGIPILEAMRLGVPVLTSGISSMPEVAGTAAILVDPYSVRSIADGLERLLTDAQLRATLIARGNDRVTTFSFRKMAEQYLALYKQLGANS